MKQRTPAARREYRRATGEGSQLLPIALRGEVFRDATDTREGSRGDEISGVARNNLPAGN